MNDAHDTVAILAIGALFLLLFGLSFLWWVGSLDMTSIEYDDYADARVGIESGWLPEWLPKSARRIQEAHDIDTNHAFAVFEFAPADAFHAQCTQVVVGELIFPRPGQVRRFPRFVTNGLKRVHEDHSLEFFRCDGRDLRSLAIDSTSGKAYLWTD